MTKRARGDIHTAISFLTTRLKAPDEDDWKKLQRLMLYLSRTKHFVSTLCADNMKMLRWSVDAAHAAHVDCKGQTGGLLKLKKGSLSNVSRKQKLNTRSSTESELVGIYDMLPDVLWTRLFLSAQGYDSTETIIDQDNKSTILLANHGKFSSTKRTKHIDIRYFYITDKIKKGEVKIEYCPTKDIVADMFTKPLQGQQFVKFRNAVLGIAA